MGDKTEGKMDKAKGQVKEGVGGLTGDDEMQREGKRDQVGGGVEKAKGHAKDAIDDVKDAIDDARN